MTIPPQQEYQEYYVPSSDTWSIGLPSWILADKNHWNGTFFGFYKNQVAPFALEINPRWITPASSQDKQVIHQGDSIYTLTGEVVFVWEHGWILDFGLQAYTHYYSTPSYVPEHRSFITIETYLGVDYFIYYRKLYKVPGIPPLIYRWHIQRIVRRRYPLVRQVGSDGRGFFAPDTTRSKYIEEEDTRHFIYSAVSDEKVFPGVEKVAEDFMLECQLQSPEGYYTAPKLEG